MNNKPFQFRYVNEIVGGFVLLVVALLVAAVILAGRAQGWFKPVYEIHIDFPSQGSLDLQVGSAVQILGATVGKIEMINVDDAGFMNGKVSVSSDFRQFVRTDSRAIAKKKFGIAGDAFIEITKGTGPEIPEGAGLVVTKDTDLNELLTDLLRQVREAVLPLLESVKLAADEYAGLAADLRAEDGALQQLLVNLESITGNIEAGKGPAGLLVSDEATAKKIEALVDQLQAIMADIKGATVELPPMARTVNTEVQTIPGTVMMTQETLRETERLIEAVQRHWLLRKYVTPEGRPTELIPIYDIRRPVGQARAPAKNEEIPE